MINSSARVRAGRLCTRCFFVDLDRTSVLRRILLCTETDFEWRQNDRFVEQQAQCTL